MKTYVREASYCEHCHLSFPLGVFPSKEGEERFGKKLHPQPWMCLDGYSKFHQARAEQQPPAA